MRGLEQIPPVYDSFMAILDRLALRRLRRSLIDAAPREPGSRPPARWLEVGCGTGRNLPHYPDEVRVIGLDPDRTVLRAARRRAPSVPLVQARAEALPFRDGAFPVVVSSLVFCSVDDPDAGLDEVARVLESGGTLRMLEHVRPRSRVGARLARLVQPFWTVVAGGCRPDRDTESTVRASGFRIDPSSRRAWSVFRRFDATPADRAESPTPGRRAQS
ncbi:MAG: class I SAM-dependent methyltransferase [Gemmatimonadales bacterium]|nr:MAG: class I SAM-dependent methyltransferase [Gemmatimonadales bacterium]